MLEVLISIYYSIFCIDLVLPILVSDLESRFRVFNTLTHRESKNRLARRQVPRELTVWSRWASPLIRAIWMDASEHPRQDLIGRG